MPSFRKLTKLSQSLGPPSQRQVYDEQEILLNLDRIVWCTKSGTGKGSVIRLHDPAESLLVKEDFDLLRRDFPT